MALVTGSSSLLAVLPRLRTLAVKLEEAANSPVRRLTRSAVALSFLSPTSSIGAALSLTASAVALSLLSPASIIFSPFSLANSAVLRIALPPFSFANSAVLRMTRPPSFAAMSVAVFDSFPILSALFLAILFPTSALFLITLLLMFALLRMMRVPIEPLAFLSNSSLYASSNLAIRSRSFSMSSSMPSLSSSSTLSMKTFFLLHRGLRLFLHVGVLPISMPFQRMMAQASQLPKVSALARSLAPFTVSMIPVCETISSNSLGAPSSMSSLAASASAWSALCVVKLRVTSP
mmetsp:Transcript_25165/g.52260  ORF Transcript_25165/g.52260 Transcript_25165/m.52260 type:complete len:290 (-) Transcript_25165:2166-3035(-)